MTPKWGERPKSIESWTSNCTMHVNHMFIVFQSYFNHFQAPNLNTSVIPQDMDVETGQDWQLCGFWYDPFLWGEKNPCLQEGDVMNKFHHIIHSQWLQNRPCPEISDHFYIESHGDDWGSGQKPMKSKGPALQGHWASPEICAWRKSGELFEMSRGYLEGFHILQNMSITKKYKLDSCLSTIPFFGHPPWGEEKNPHIHAHVVWVYAMTIWVWPGSDNFLRKYCTVTSCANCIAYDC